MIVSHAPDVATNAYSTAGSVLRRALSVTPRVPVKLEGSSMAPLIRADTLAMVERCTVLELKVGDVAVYVRADIVVAHVVRRIDPTGPRPSALGSRALERPITAEMLLGRLDGMVLRSRHLQYTPPMVARAVARGIGALVRLRNRLAATDDEG
jgi:hypothetical protein